MTAPLDSPQVSVIVPNWNGRELLRRCLEALERQTYRSFVAVVVDNGSQDGSAAMVASEFPEVRLLYLPENQGFAAATNRGIAASDTPFVATLNNDAEPEPGWLEHLMAAAEEDPAVGMWASHIVLRDRPDVVDSTGIAVDVVGIAWDRDAGARDPLGRRPGAVFGPCAAAALYRRKMLDEVGLFDEDFFSHLEDVDLAWRGRLAGWRCGYVPQAKVYHVRGATAHRWTDATSARLGRNKVWTVVKNYPLPQLALRLPVILAYDVMAVLYALVVRRDVASFVGRLQGLVGLPAAWRKRRRVQRLRRDGRSGLELEPLASPWGVWGRYRPPSRR